MDTKHTLKTRLVISVEGWANYTAKDSNDAAQFLISEVVEQISKGESATIRITTVELSDDEITGLMEWEP